MLGAGVGCGTDDSDSGSTSDELQLEQAPIPTMLKELRAGLPYIPGIDESPLGGGATTCLPNAKMQVRGSAVSSSAAILHTRSSLNVELGLDATGTLPTSGITGAASIAAKTSFDSRSASVLFQSTGTYETSLTNEATPVNFDPANVAKCGFGYIVKAQHRVSAALLVTMHSQSSSVDVKASANAGKPNIAEVKTSLSTVVQKGNVEIQLHFATDVVPNMPAPPFAEASLNVGDSDSDKAAALAKIDTALTWLANAQTAINTYLATLQQSADGTGGPPAPAVNVTFHYYPATPPEVRNALEATVKTVDASRHTQADVNSMITSWETYKKAVTSGAGYEWNVAADVADNVDALTAKATDYLDANGGKLRTYESTLSAQIEACSLVLRNDPPAPDVPTMVANMTKSCAPAAALPVDRAKALIQPISASSVSETSGGQTCEAGYRLPMQKEAKIFNAWSKSLKEKSEGLWVQDPTGCFFQGSSWIFDGAVACSGILPKSGLAVCVPSNGPLPSDP